MAAPDRGGRKRIAFSSLPRSASWPPGPLLLAGSAALVAIALIDWWLSAAPRGLLARGVTDETAHLLTAIILALALVPGHLPSRFLASVLIGAVVIDLDHLPLILGSDLLTRDTNRPLTHSLLVVIIALAAVLLLPRRWRWIALGIAAGLAAHFWRDLATSTAGVPLLWPIDGYGFRLPYGIYFAVLVICLGFAVWRSARASRNTRVSS